MDSFNSLASIESKRVGELLGRILKKFYQTDLKTIAISFDDLLRWNLWPNFIHIYCKSTVICVKARSCNK